MNTLREWYFSAVAQPTLFVLAGAPFAWVLLYLLARCGLKPDRVLRVAGMAGLAVSAGVTVAIFILYAFRPDLIDHVEPHVVSRAALWIQGHPLYHTWDEPYAFSTAYGPLSYLPIATSLLLFGSGMFAAKLPGVVAFLISLGITWRENRMRPRGGWFAAALLLALSPLFIQAAFWTRSDPMLVLGASVAVICLRIRSSTTQAALLGLLAGLLINCKIHGPLYLLPLALVVLFRAPVKGTLVAVLLAVPVALAPFLIPGVDARAFFDSLGLMADQSRDASRFWANIHWLAFIAMPFAVLAAPDAWTWVKQSWTTSGAVILGILLGGVITSVLAAKAGAGAWHLLPWLPWLVWLACRFPVSLAQTSSPRITHTLLASWIGATVLLVWTRQDDYIVTLWKSPASDAIAEINRIAASHPGTRIQMGLGESSHGRGYASTFARTSLVFIGQGSDYDSCALMDLGSVGHSTPEGLADKLLGGGVTLFLIPAGEAPFALHNVYNGAPLFTDSFRQRFAENFELMEKGSVYDVWIRR